MGTRGENHADPQVTPLGTTAPWYFLWIQGMLKLGDPTLMGVIMPTLMFGLLFAVLWRGRAAVAGVVVAVAA